MLCEKEAKCIRKKYWIMSVSTNYASAKNIDSGQPAQYAQADQGQNFFAGDQFSACLRTILLPNLVDC